MDAPTLALLGIAIVAAAKALDALAAYLKSLIARRRNGGGQSSVPDLRAELKELQAELHVVAEQVEDLHTWHNQRDDDGVLKWTNKSSTVKAILQLEIDVRAIKERQGRGCPVLRSTEVPIV